MGVSKKYVTIQCNTRRKWRAQSWPRHSRQKLCWGFVCSFHRSVAFVNSLWTKIKGRTWVVVRGKREVGWGTRTKRHERRTTYMWWQRSLCSRRKQPRRRWMGRSRLRRRRWIGWQPWRGSRGRINRAPDRTVMRWLRIIRRWNGNLMNIPSTWEVSFRNFVERWWRLILMWVAHFVWLLFYHSFLLLFRIDWCVVDSRVQEINKIIDLLVWRRRSNRYFTTVTPCPICLSSL